METDKLVSFETTHCTWCGETSVMELPAEKLDRILHTTEHIQSILPEHSDAERELIMTGTHLLCWNAMFPAEDEPDMESPSPAAWLP